MDLKMEVWAQACSGITAQGDDLSLCYRIVGGTQCHIDIRCLMLVLPFSHQCLNGRGEPLEVGIHAGITLRMANIHRIAHSADIDGDPANIAVTNRIHRLAFHLLGLDVKTTMEMVGPGFSEIPCQGNIEMNR